MERSHKLAWLESGLAFATTLLAVPQLMKKKRQIEKKRQARAMTEHTYGQWGTAQYYIDPEHDMYVSGGKLQGSLYQALGEHAHTVRHLYFTAPVQAPQDSYWLLSGAKDVHDSDNTLEGIYGLSNVDTAHVQNMRQMFYGNRALQKLDLNSWNTSHVTDMFEIFGDDRSLHTLHVEDWDVHNVVDFTLAFYRTYQLTNLDLSHWEFPAGTDMSQMFIMES